MNIKLTNKILLTTVLILLGFILYQNIIMKVKHIEQITGQENDQQLWTCGMHPDIVVEEPGNCPICEMKLTIVKSDNEQNNREKEIEYWVAPMDPNEVYKEPGKSKMGMDLIPVYKDAIGQAGLVTIDPTVQQNMNVKFTKIENSVLNPSILTSAVFTIDERTEHQITSRVGGWVEKMHINFIGQNVKKGEKLFEIYSPELVAAQQEYLTAIKYKNKVENSTFSASGEDLINNAYNKLTLLNMDDNDILKLEHSKKVLTNVPVYSPVNGVVINKTIVEGEKIKPGDNLIHLADLTKLWLKADIYESDIYKVKINNEVEIKVDAFPEIKFKGRVAFIYPTIDSKTRVAKVRINVPNNNLMLKPSMLAKAKIFSNDKKKLPIIDETAVIRTGQSNVVIQYLGENKFFPVNIELGHYADGYYQVLSGLQEGNVVVTSAQFLIDSESSLKSAMKNLKKSKEILKDDINTNGVQKSKTSENEYGITSPLIRTGEINLNEIDDNSDGKLFECLMDWNIIADEYHLCPLCEMRMKEYTLDEVKRNLKENGYLVK